MKIAAGRKRQALQIAEVEQEASSSGRLTFSSDRAGPRYHLYDDYSVASDHSRPLLEADYFELEDMSGARFADTAYTGDKEKGELDRQITTTDNDSSRYAASAAGLDHKHQNKVAERKLLFKLDVILLPLCMVLYLSAYLDRGNMGAF